MVLELQIDPAGLFRFIESGKRAIERALDLNAEGLKEAVERESRSASARVASSWEVEEIDGLDRRVVSDVFFAHFLAGGTASHGPVSAQQLVFDVDGQTVRASLVSGVRANPFDERAIDSVESRVDDFIERALSEVV